MAHRGLVLFLVTATAAAVSAGVADAGPAKNTAAFVPVCAGKLAAVACQVRRLASGPGGAYSSVAAKPVGWGADDLRDAYDLPPSPRSPGTIAIIDVGAYPRLEADLAVYRMQYGLPPCTAGGGCFRQLDLHGGPPLPPAESPDDKSIDEQIAVETALDVDMASAACPACRILEVQIPHSALPTPSTDPARPLSFDGYAAAFGDAVQTAIDHGADAVSMSYGLPGSASMLTGPIAAKVAHRGVAIVASSGDSGFEGTKFLWPQALPTVTSVGGTELVKEAGRFSEGAWSFGGSSCAPGAAPPAGQPGEVGALCGGARTGVDISAVADNLAIYDSYSPMLNRPIGWTVAAGTSASAPFIAGVYVASGGLSEVDGPNTLYQAGRSTFHDITSGTNGVIGNGRCITAETYPDEGTGVDYDSRLCTTGNGWDGPTGLGSPRGLLPN
jgi:subtilase family serine protease